ncbi:Uridine kinase [Streptomyces sp. TLI_053]|uniref:uridine kinase family protein n=1 Tax=Streptomyces sp. TLI_053 TaxID=1855352 RepID=UPI00087BFEEA|nr:AAA family ATPase [Streptomyces sp. TLI_053]SDS59046.1 Uridine kinase [Streptomyces sp. TLI_053]
MFENIRGLSPEHAARLTHLVEQCEPLLDRDEGMERAQRLLRDLGVEVMDSIIVTRGLLGAGPGDLGEAKRIVLSSAARTTELSSHQQLTDVVEQARDVADGLLNLARTQEATTRIIAIDGTGGSGKTTLAAAVALNLDGAVIVHVDDFYRPMPDHEREQLDAEQGYHRYFDWERLRDQVLIPLRDRQAARYQIYDWTTGQLGAWREIAPGTVVIVEGVYSTRPELARYYHFTTYVDTPRDVCLQRVRARGENPEAWIERWRAAEDYYLHTTWPQSRAKLLVSGC